MQSSRRLKQSRYNLNIQKNGCLRVFEREYLPQGVESMNIINMDKDSRRTTVKRK
jgi:hypothetical protein